MEHEYKKHKIYYEALNRLIKAEKRPTKRSVAIEAGKDGGSIREERGMPNLIDAIIEAEKEYYNKKDSVEAKQKKKTNSLKEKIEEKDKTITRLKKEVADYQFREFIFLRKVRDLELELVSKNKSKPTLSDLSSNLPDWTKV